MNTPPLHIAIFGAGSIGCYLGGLLADSEAQVTFIGRQRFKSELEANGLTLTHFERDEVFIPATHFTFSLNAADIGQADVILLTTKSQDTAEAAKAIHKHTKSDALVISFQNGVSNPSVLRETLKTQIVLGAVVPFNVTGAGPGRFHCGTEGDLTVEINRDSRLAILKALFGQAGQGITLAGKGVVITPDIDAVQWGKLLVNLNNALNTLTGGTLKNGLLQRDYRKALAMIIEEALNVVRGAGIEPANFGKASPTKMIKILRLPNFIYKIIMNKIVKIDAAARSSMLDDLEMGRVSEIDYLQGEIVRLAEQTGQSAPYNAAIYRAVENAFKVGKSPKMCGTDIYRYLIAALK